jgi:hypothetical protein
LEKWRCEVSVVGKSVALMATAVTVVVSFELLNCWCILIRFLFLFIVLSFILRAVVNVNWVSLAIAKEMTDVDGRRDEMKLW